MKQEYFEIGQIVNHFGIKGMKWGVRKTKSEARKDAHEYARAKMFYGEGAGIRRKKIKARVDTRYSFWNVLQGNRSQIRCERKKHSQSMHARKHQCH